MRLACITAMVGRPTQEHHTRKSPKPIPYYGREKGTVSRDLCAPSTAAYRRIRARIACASDTSVATRVSSSLAAGSVVLQRLISPLSSRRTAKGDAEQGEGRSSGRTRPESAVHAAGTPLARGKATGTSLLRARTSLLPAGEGARAARFTAMTCQADER